MKYYNFIRSLLKENEYRGQHKAPYNNGYDRPLYDVSSAYPDDIYTDKMAYRYYGSGDLDNDKNNINIIRLYKDKPEKTINIYRAVPKDNNITEINDGDWVTLSLKYAKNHGESYTDGGYKILSKKVPSKHVWTDGNSLDEFGYDSK